MFEDWGDVAALDSVSVYNWTLVPIVWTYSKYGGQSGFGTCQDIIGF